MKTWKAAADKVIVHIPPRSRVTDTGIVLPAKVRQEPVLVGTVLAAGPDAKGVLPGDHVSIVEKGSYEVAHEIYALGVDYVLAIQREQE